MNVYTLIGTQLLVYKNTSKQKSMSWWGGVTIVVGEVRFVRMGGGEKTKGTESIAKNKKGESP